ncbi:MAG: DUF5719 family protein, partial [Actinomycetota bacterium]|nr:DUF5719 family protein [Actinomycetota bacterium]
GPEDARASSNARAADGESLGSEGGSGDESDPAGEDEPVGEDPPPGSPSTVPGAVLQAWLLGGLTGGPTWVADASGITADVSGSADGSGSAGGGTVGETLAVASGEHATGLVARAQPVAELAPRVAGAVVSTVAAGDLRGTTAAACQSPGSEFWLAGGGTELGTTTLLVVHNPGATPAEISLEMWGPAGPVELGGGARYIVPSGGELTLRLSALAAELARTVVRVMSAGGQIAAYLQVSELDGFTPGGSELVVPGSAPASRQVIPSVVVPESDVGGAGSGLLRLLVPSGGGAGVSVPEGEGSELEARTLEGQTEADGQNDGGEGQTEPDDQSDDESQSGAEAQTEDEGGARADLPVRVRVAFYGESGPVTLPGTEELTLVPGEVTDVDLGGLPAGAYAVVVDADAPVLASARIERLGSPANAGEPVPVENAWIAGSSGSAADLVAVPAGLTADVVLSAVPATRSASSTLENLGSPITGQLRAFDEFGAVLVSEAISVSAGSTLRVPLPQGVAAVELTEVPALADGAALGDETARTAGSSLAWGVLITSRGADGDFLSVLTAPVHGAAVGEVAVRHAQRLPLE